MDKTVISQDELFKFFYERKTLSWVQLGEMFSFSGTNDTSRQVLGAIGSLVVDGFVEKLPGITPPIWKITKSGISKYTGKPLTEEETEMYNLQVHDVGPDMKPLAGLDVKLGLLNNAVEKLRLELEQVSASARRSHLLSQLSLAAAIICVIILVFLSQCHT